MSTHVAREFRPLITKEAAREAYRAANDRGEGYAPFTDVPGDDTIEHAIKCFEADGWSLVFERNVSDDVAVLRNDDGEFVAIGGDAMGCGAWAVPIVFEERS